MPALLGYYGSVADASPDCFDRFSDDERAIEGLPIRLVIALVVGVASLGVMMNMLSGLGGLTVTELDAAPAPDVIGPGEQKVTVTVVDPEGNPVSDATVVVSGGTASLDGVKTATTDENGNATLSVDPTLAPNQREGTLDVRIKPPAGSDYADERENAAILVLAGE
ncbi:carboxypeptidase regulatory-like domain-containing protein [Halorussus gelatinilyticus]|uniref:Carboxypeptidase regulatory-like domain-containing protein n=1 Tax=Halorussus gelatinilyticus TaxID=2937524 RepID=A0A8U0IMA4_9EURY|nr:carboxypeptidase regulatory-like domain-containing protein [Halorussus gelatinilyticus]UPW02270.1 carboxypeptidase regulatory-like domain-containing protein [Halorussus gelatinilyticus]